jgi:hypothetical protein
MPEDAMDSKRAEARLAEVSARFGDRLTDEQTAQVKRRIERSVRLSQELRTKPVTNSDEPEIVFAPYRGES